MFFFDSKIRESEDIVGWTEVSIKKLKSTIPRYLFEAGLISSSSRNKKIIRARMDYRLEKLFEVNNMIAYYYAITAEV